LQAAIRANLPGRQRNALADANLDRNAHFDADDDSGRVTDANGHRIANCHSDPFAERMQRESARAGGGKQLK
jgi:hypothetical protein